jgi:hypothetical protein
MATVRKQLWWLASNVDMTYILSWEGEPLWSKTVFEIVRSNADVMDHSRIMNRIVDNIVPRKDKELVSLKEAKVIASECHNHMGGKIKYIQRNRLGANNARKR